MAAILIYVLAVLVALVAGWQVLSSVVGDRAKGRIRCPKCWYDMRAATSLTCPECGYDAQDAKNLLRTRRSYRRLAIGIVCVPMAAYLVVVGGRIRHSHEPVQHALVPTTIYALAWPEFSATWRHAAVKRITQSRLKNPAIFGPTRIEPARSNLPRTLWTTPVAWAWQIDLFVWRGVGAKLQERQTDPIAVSDITKAVDCAPRSCRLLGPLLDAPTPLSQPEVQTVINSLSHSAQFGAADEAVRVVLTHREAISFLDQARIFAMVPLETWDRLGDQDLLRTIDTSDGGSTLLIGLPDAQLISLSKRPDIAKATLTQLLTLDVRPFPQNKVAILALLRKLEGHPSPLAVQTTERSLRWSAQDKGPLIHASLVNVDKVKPAEVSITHGGDNRGSRAERWRLSLRGADGRESFAPVDSSNFGGLYHHGSLPPDRPFEISLPIGAYIERPAPGRYSLVVQYHDAQQISAMRDVSELILFESAPIELIVE